MSRKIIQITGAGVENNLETQCSTVLWALCDDGTIWCRYGSPHHGTWERLPSIPTDDEPSEGPFGPHANHSVAAEF